MVTDPKLTLNGAIFSITDNTSPVIDAGIPLLNARDILGNVRGAKLDIGAVEYKVSQPLYPTGISVKIIQ
jgi:hypothetical protein